LTHQPRKVGVTESQTVSAESNMPTWLYAYTL